MLNSDYRDMLSALSEAKAEYLLIGAYALATHGLVRATKDLDLWVRPTPENAERVVEALVAFGAPTDLPWGFHATQQCAPSRCGARAD